MSLLKHITAAALALLLAAVTVAARPITEAEREALAETVEAFDAKIRAGDYGALIEHLPPRVLKHMEDEAGVTAEQLRDLMAQEMERAVSAGVKLEAFRMDLANAEHRELPGGDPYLLIPTETVIDGGERGRLRAKSHALALLDDGSWHLLRVEDAQQLLILRQVYPDFVGVEFPGGSMEALK